MINEKIKIPPPQTPLEAHIQLVNRCNLDCNLCPYILDRYTNLMNKNDLIFLINKLSDNKINHVLISGGNPLLHPDFLFLLNYISYKDIDSSALIPVSKNLKDLIKKIIETDVKLFVSVNLYEIKKHNLMKVFEEINDYLDKFQDRFAYVVHLDKPNLKHIGIFIKKSNSKNIIIQHKIPTLKKHNGFFCSEQEALKCYENCKKINKNVFFMSELFDYSGTKLKICGAGRFKISILPDGTVVPCEWIENFKKYSCGNILEDDIVKIWDHENMRDFLNLEKYTLCLNCSKINMCSSCSIPLINKIITKREAVCTLLNKDKAC